MNTPREILDGLGSEAVAARLGVEHRRVKNASYESRLPAAWYATLSEMAGHDLPRDAFTFKRAESA
jgi:hypothetical protein